jgi:oligopeptide transport system ATP-binding protein
MPLLILDDLNATFHIAAGDVQAVRGLSLQLEEGESIGIVGESGSGKSAAMLSVMGLLPATCEVSARSIVFNNIELTRIGRRDLRKLLGKDIGMVFQDPMTSLNPLYTIGSQLTESLRLHLRYTPRQARERALELLRMVEIPSPETRLKQYPYELSGGMRQRVMIASAISCNPKLIIADEPTTALDVTIQAQILDLLMSLKQKLNVSIVLISHDLGVITSLCRRILVMYGGMMVETGTTREVFYDARHPYTWGLLRSRPSGSPQTQSADGARGRLVSLPGAPPDMLHPPPGCPFAPRCPHAMRICNEYIPPITDFSSTHAAACHLVYANARLPKKEASHG